MKLGVKVIHCSERDTQISDQPKQVDEFVNTWSIEGFREEGTTTAEMGWGTHEKELPPLAYEHQDGPRNQICLARMGMNTWVRSWVPNYSIQGHGGPPRRGLHDLRPAHGLGRRQGGLPAHGALRLLPLRRGDRLAATSCAATTTSCSRKLRIMTRRDHRRRRHPGRAADGPRLQLLVDRQRPEHRGVAAAGAAPERHHHAGGHLGGGGRDLDDRQSRPGRAGARRPAATNSSWRSLALPGQVDLHAVRLDAAEALQATAFTATTSPTWTTDDPWQFKNFLITDRITR